MDTQSVVNNDWIFSLYAKEIADKSKHSDKGKLKKEDYYMKDGNVVLTEKYHLKRGQCCGNICKHCVYSPIHVKGSKELRNKD